MTAGEALKSLEAGCFLCNIRCVSLNMKKFLSKKGAVVQIFCLDSNHGL